MKKIFEIKIKLKALKDLKDISKKDKEIIFSKIESFLFGLVGDIKHLTNFTSEYRLRVGNYRILFEIV